jgi:adenylate cyclase
MQEQARFTFRGNYTGWPLLLIAFSGLILGFFPSLIRLEEEFGLRLLFTLRGPEQPSEDIVIVGIGRESAMRLQAPDDPQLWPRRLHAEAIRLARQAEAELVAFNILFLNPAPDSSDDREIAAAMRNAGNVVLTNYVKPRNVYSGIYFQSVVQPTAELNQAALATAPVLLTRNNNDHAGQFLPFFGGEEEMATLPTMLLFAHAVKTAGAWFDPLVADEFSNWNGFIRKHPGTEPGSFNGLQEAFTAHLNSHRHIAAEFDDSPPQATIPEKTRRVLRSLLRVHEERGSRYLNFYGPARTFSTLPYYQLFALSPEQLVKTLKNKIVLIGYLEDFRPEDTEGLFYTPFSSISSVELTATSVANLLEDKAVRPALTLLEEMLGYLAFGGLLGLCALRRSMHKGVAAILVLGFGYLFVAWYLFASAGWWLPLVVPVFWQTPLAIAGCVLTNYLYRSRKEKRMRTVIERFIPGEVFSQLTRQENMDTLPNVGRLVRGICLATDAGRYTALAETTEPMQLAQLMNRYYAAIFHPVAQKGGWISDVIGDAMLAIWTTEGDDTLLRHSVLEAALEIQQAVRRFEQAHGLEFPVRIGIHCGDIRVGYVGTHHHGEIRAIGDTVNTAVRLEALNKTLDTEILASEEVIAGLSVRRTRALGRFFLAGKAKPISVVELVSPASERPANCEDLDGRFEEALNLLESGHWRAADDAFAGIVHRFPDDGPSRFYQKTCRSHLVDSDAAGCFLGISTDKTGAARPLIR